MRDILAVDQDLSAGGRQGTVQQAQQCRFTGTGRPGQKYELTLLDPQSDIGQGGGVLLIGQGYVVQLNHYVTTLNRVCWSWG